jgi:hypothetical protein
VQTVLLPLTKTQKKGAKGWRLTSVVFPRFLVSSANGYILPAPHRLEFAIFAHTNLVCVPGLYAAGMCPDACALVLQDVMRVVVFETHLAVSPPGGHSCITTLWLKIVVMVEDLALSIFCGISIIPLLHGNRCPSHSNPPSRANL